MNGLAAAQRSYDRQEFTGRTWSEMTDEEQAEDCAEATRAKIDAANKARFFDLSYAQRLAREALWDAVTVKRLAEQSAA